MKQETKFKQTEIGKIPEDWEVKSVNEVSDIFLGGTPKTTEKEYWDGDIKWASAKDVSNCKSRYINKTERTITQKGIDNSAAKILPKNTVVVTSRGTVGGLALLSAPMSFNQTCYGLKAKQNTDPLFLYYKLKSQISRLASVSYGTVFDTITMRTFDELKMSFPGFLEQQSIAKILSDLDSKIELNQQMNKTLEVIGQAIFKRWFVDFEFPNEEGKPYKSAGGEMVDSELGKIPKGWKVKPIDEIADFLNGLPLQKFPPENEGEYLPVIKIRELRQGISESSDKASVNIPKEYVISDGDIIFSWSGSLEVIIWVYGKGALNQHLFKVTSDNYPKWFCYYWIKEFLPEYKHIAEEKATTMGHIQRRHLKSSLVLCPDKRTLSKMNTILENVINRIIMIGTEIKNLSQIRDLLLPKLMSGKIRVKTNKVLSHA